MSESSMMLAGGVREGERRFNQALEVCGEMSMSGNNIFEYLYSSHCAMSFTGSILFNLWKVQRTVTQQRNNQKTEKCSGCLGKRCLWWFRCRAPLRKAFCTAVVDVLVEHGRMIFS